jgi:CDP-diglyceride synthetase
MVEQASDAFDADSGLYNGFVIGSTLIMLVLAAVVISAMNNVLPDFVGSMKDNMIIVLAVFVVVAGITAVVGYMMGKAVARQTAMKNASGQGTAG